MGVYIFLLIFLMFQIPVMSLAKRRETIVLVGSQRVSVVTLITILDVLLLLFFAAFRGNQVGTDTKVYNYWFSELRNISLIKIAEWSEKSAIEPGFGILAKIGVTVFEANYGAWLLIFTVMLASIARFCNSFSRNVAFSFYLYLTFSLYNQAFNISGQCVAGSLLLISLIYLKKDNLKGFFISLILAILAHRSAIIGALLLFLYKTKKKSVRLGAILVCFSLVLSRFATPVVNYIVSRTIYSHYLHWEVSSEGGIALLMNSLLFTCFVLFYKDMKDVDEQAGLYIYASAITLSLNFFIGTLGMIARVMVYFKLFYIVSIPCFVDAISLRFQSPKVAQIAKFVIVLLFAIYYCYSIAFSTCFGTVPYSFVW